MLNRLKTNFSLAKCGKIYIRKHIFKMQGRAKIHNKKQKTIKFNYTLYAVDRQACVL